MDITLVVIIASFVAIQFISKFAWNKLWNRSDDMPLPELILLVVAISAFQAFGFWLAFIIVRYYQFIL